MKVGRGPVHLGGGLIEEEGGWRACIQGPLGVMVFDTVHPDRESAREECEQMRDLVEGLMAILGVETEDISQS